MALGIKEKSTCTFTIIAIKKNSETFRKPFTTSHNFSEAIRTPLGKHSDISETIHNFSQLLGNNSETSRKTLGASRKPFGPQSDKPAALSEAVDMYMVLLLDICIQSAA